jgi:transcriptional regulator with XRE-family HTH domain
MDTTKTGGYLAALRKDAGMTQQEAADRLGVSNKAISKWESGGGFPDIAILPALAELYGVTADDILAGETVRQSTGGRQVEQYLAQRYGLRWRIGYAVAALCLLAAVLFRPYVWVWLLLAGAAAAVWIGWGRCGKDELRTRLLMLFPLAAALGFMVLGKCFPSQSVYDRVAATVKDLSGFTLFNYVVEHVVWDEMLVLLAVLYFLARCILRRHGDGAKLLGPVAFRWALAGWAASLLIEIPRWLVVTPRLAAYVENGIFSDPAISAAYTNAARWFAVLRWGVVAVTLVLMALAERKKAAEAPQQTENAGEMK